MPAARSRARNPARHAALNAAVRCAMIDRAAGIIATVLTVRHRVVAYFTASPAAAS
ncbi:protein of unknown function [Thauera humireducens]|nr:protein of unknown function [Thauera humireducens]